MRSNDTHKRQRKKHLLEREHVASAAIALILLLVVFTSFARGQLNSLLEVSFIDVGQGDSILLRASDGTHVLVDAGNTWAGPTVVDYLQEQDVDALDVVVMSHGHADHIGGLIDLFQSDISVAAVVYNGQPCTTSVCDAVWGEMQRRGLTPTPAVAGQTHTWGALEAEILNPQPTPRANQNEDSVVKVVTYGETRFLFTGDIGTSTESTILCPAMSMEADALKVAHHGSRYSSSSDFLAAVGPEVAVVCVGDNTYGHPTDEALQRLREAGAQVCRTDLHGTVVIVSDGQAIEYTCGADYDYLTFLPLVLSQHVPGAPPTPPRMPGENVVCEEIGNVQICGSVSNATPSQYSTVTVYGRYLVDGVGQAGQTMDATWHYKYSTPNCTDVTGSDGMAQCSRYISGATIGYQVYIDVEIDGYTVTTSFTPQ